MNSYDSALEAQYKIERIYGKLFGVKVWCGGAGGRTLTVRSCTALPNTVIEEIEKICSECVVVFENSYAPNE